MSKDVGIINLILVRGRDAVMSIDLEDDMLLEAIKGLNKTSNELINKLKEVNKE